jgi:putative ABC transport system permease protein
MTAGLSRTGSPRWRMALRLLIRSLDLRASSFALALMAVVVGSSVTTTTFNLRADLERKMTRELRAYGPNLLLTPPLAAGQEDTLEQTWVEGIAARAPAGATVWVAPFLLAPGRAGEEFATLMGVDFAATRELAATWQLDGSWPEGDGCLLGVSLAGRLDLAPGASVPVRVAGAEPRVLTVAGLVSTGESEDESVLVPLPWLQAATGATGRVSAAAVALEAGPDEVERFAAALQSSAPFALEARPLVQVSRAQGALLDKLDGLMTALTLVVLLLAGMCVMTTLMSIVVERESEIGLMRSLGASNNEVLRMLLGEATLLGLLGAGLGLGLGMWNAHWMGRQLFAASILPRAEVVPWVLGITLGLCWMAVLVPLRRALAVQPASSLRGD